MRRWSSWLALGILLMTSAWLHASQKKPQPAAKAPKATANGPVFGVGWTADSLANLEIGRFPGRTVSYRFRATHTGTVSSIRVYFIFRKFCDGCYANGDGGQVAIQFSKDDDSSLHLPGTVMSSALVTDPTKEWNRLVKLDRPVNLQAGKIYHIVFSNPLTTATKNYVSIDDLFTREPGPGLQPSAQASDLAVLFKSTGKSDWELKEQHVPIVAILFDDGYQQGQGYIDVKHNVVVLSSGQTARESFEFPGPDQTLKRLAVRLQPTNGKGKVTIEFRGPGGQLLAFRDVVVKDVPRLPQWETLEFASPITLKKLGKYDLVIAAKDGAELTVVPLQKGTEYGFNPDTLFKAGHCEIRLTSQWSGCGNRPDLDIPFYLQ